MMSDREWARAHRETRYERVYGILLTSWARWTVDALAAMDGTDVGTMRAVLREGEELGHYVRAPHPTRRCDVWTLSQAERGAGYAEGAAGV